MDSPHRRRTSVRNGLAAWYVIAFFFASIAVSRATKGDVETSSLTVQVGDVDPFRLFDLPAVKSGSTPASQGLSTQPARPLTECAPLFKCTGRSRASNQDGLVTVLRFVDHERSEQAGRSDQGLIQLLLPEAAVFPGMVAEPSPFGIVSIPSPLSLGEYCESPDRDRQNAMTPAPSPAVPDIAEPMNTAIITQAPISIVEHFELPRRDRQNAMTPARSEAVPDIAEPINTAIITQAPISIVEHFESPDRDRQDTMTPAPSEAAPDIAEPTIPAVIAQAPVSIVEHFESPDRNRQDAMTAARSEAAPDTTEPVTTEVIAQAPISIVEHFESPDRNRQDAMTAAPSEVAPHVTEQTMTAVVAQSPLSIGEYYESPGRERHDAMTPAPSEAAPDVTEPTSTEVIAQEIQTTPPPQSLTRVADEPVAPYREAPAETLPPVEELPAIESVAMPVPTAKFPESPATPTSSDATITPTQSSQLRLPIAKLVQQRIQYAENLASRGAIYVAEAEFYRALQMVAYTKDAEQRADRHSRALTAAIIALEEANDFAELLSPTTANSDVQRLVAAHRTPVLKSDNMIRIPALFALQEYFTYAKNQFVVAVGQEPVASRALSGLAVIQTARTGSGFSLRTMGPAKAIALYQAAITVDPRSSQAANELGVLQVKFGRLDQAKRAFLISTSSTSRAEPWENLAMVYSRLGEQGRADDARQRAEGANQLSQQANASGSELASGATARWVSPAEFSEPTGESISKASAPTNAEEEALSDTEERKPSISGGLGGALDQFKKRLLSASSRKSVPATRRTAARGRNSSRIQRR